jgi:hypothetical protein
METDALVREQVLWLLRGGNAHMPFEDAVADFPPPARINDVFPNGTYTPWHLLEHLRISQWDILDFIRNPNYQEMEWPKDYWPAPDSQATESDWQRTIAQFQDDMRQLQQMVADPRTDLHTPIPHGTGQTILREMLLVADHNAYHIGEFAIMRQVMGTWGPGHSS